MPINAVLAANVATHLSIPHPPVFIKEGSCSASRSLGHSLPSDSLVGELYGVIALQAVRSEMVIGFCGEAIHRFIGMDL